MNNIDREVGQIIKRRRRELMMTQEQLGKKLGVAYSTVACWERGIRGMSLDVFFRCCEILSLDPNEIQKKIKGK